jgi:uncharacterized protein YoxC
MSGGQIAALIAACALLLLVGLLAVPLLKLGRTLDETTRLVAGINAQTPQLLDQVGTTLGQTTTALGQTNTQLAKVDTITDRAGTVASNVAGLSSLFTATLGGPLVRVAALSYGVRRAISTRRRADVNARVRDEMKAERRGARRADR